MLSEKADKNTNTIHESKLIILIHKVPIRLYPDGRRRNAFSSPSLYRRILSSIKIM